MEKKFTIIKVGERWPSGDYIPVALLPMAPDELAYLLDTDLNSGEEDGLGPWVGAGIRLASGDLVEFVCYEYFRGAKSIEVRVDRSAQAKKVLRKILTILNVEESELTWVSEFIQDL